MGEKASVGQGEALATDILDSGKAWEKFQRICITQGGLKTPVIGPYRQIIKSDKSGMIMTIDNRKIAKVAKLAGAPDAATAGIYLFVSIGLTVEQGQDLYEIYAESPGELAYALEYLKANADIIKIEAS
jgi:thymidine phosphorylase